MIGKLLIVLGLAAGLMLSTAVSIAAEETTTINGTIVCLGCTLKKTEGANAACKIYGHKHGLATEDGDLYSFLENKNSEEVINSDKYAMKEVTVTGRVFDNAHIIDLESISVAEKKKGGYGKGW